MFGQEEWRSCDLWSCGNLWPVDCIQANKISHGGLWCNDRVSKVLAGIAEGAEIRVQGFWHESYAKKLWTEKLHHVFALEVHGLGMFHHVFTLDSLSGCYLGHLSDASGGLCMVAVSYLDICVSWTDKPLWLDGYLWLDDSLCFIFKLSLNNRLFRVYVLVHLYSISLA